MSALFTHRHEASYEHDISTGWPDPNSRYGITRGTCHCGERVFQLIEAGMTSITNWHPFRTEAELAAIDAAHAEALTMMSTDTRTHGVIVHVVSEPYLAVPSDYKYDAQWVGMGVAVAQSQSGHCYVLDSEGVGTSIPTDTYRLILQCNTCTDADLANFVRCFGSRLESNFWLWWDKLSN